MKYYIALLLTLVGCAGATDSFPDPPPPTVLRIGNYQYTFTGQQPLILDVGVILSPKPVTIPSVCTGWVSPDYTLPVARVGWILDCQSVDLNGFHYGRVTMSPDRTRGVAEIDDVQVTLEKVK